ncbi:MAG: nucleotidyltransferase family protein [Elusimicrobia bacterium]|nr:nucleotidyltransferase family protein [Elusimicrobiota bacterium]
MLELHWALKPPGTCSPSLDRLWKEAARTSREGMTFLDMSSEDALSHMATNKGHQHFSSLIDFVDIAMILQSRTVDWEKFIAQSLADNTEGPAWFALSCCMELFGSDVPPFVLETLFRSPGAWPAALLRGLLRIWGQPHRAPRALTRGPMGRIYETLLEGHPSFAFNLLRPLLFPPRAKLHVLSKGSLPRYYLNQLRKLKSH